MKKRLGLLIIIGAILSPLGWSQSVPISGFVIDQYGQPVAGAKVYICNAATSTGLPCTPPATIYQDFNLSSPIANPTTTDANGDFNVYVGPLAFPNVYVVNAVPQAGTTYTLLYPGPSCPLSGCTFSGNVTAPIFNATMSPYYEINGVQISSSALSDAANIAFLNASNVFTGAVQTAPIWNATGSFEVNGVALASTNLSDSANLARLNASNVFTGATNTFEVVVGTTINATTGYQIGGAAASNHVLLGNGTDYVDSATIPYSIISGAPAAPFSGASVLPWTTSTTTSTAATSANVVSVLNTSPTTIFAAPLLPKATSSAFGAVEPDNSTITISGGVITSVSTLAITQKYCLSQTCAGGSTYTFGTVYTNLLTVPVYEEIELTGGASEGCTTDQNHQVMVTVYGTARPGITWANNSAGSDCNSLVPLSFWVPAGETFEITQASYNGAPAARILVWWEDQF